MVNQPQLGQLGSPRFQITKKQLEFLNTYKFSAPLMAETLHTSESTIRKRLRFVSIYYNQFQIEDILFYLCPAKKYVVAFFAYAR